MAIKKIESDWGDKEIQNFWDWFGANNYLQHNYFSKQVGKGLVKFLSRFTDFSGKILDYGCGPGYLLEELLKQKGDCYGFEFSEKSIELLSDKFKEYSNFKEIRASDKLPVPYDNDFFETITSIEMIEHLKDEFLPSYFNEMKRLIKPGGVILITTPYNENLDANMIYCPFCDSEYHRVQHMRTFTDLTLSKLISDYGLKVVYCKPVNLYDFQKKAQSILEVNAYSIYYFIREFFDKIKYYFGFTNKNLGYYYDKNSKSARHLCAIVTKDQ